MASITLAVEGSLVGTLAVPVVMESEQSDRLMAYIGYEYGTYTDAENVVQQRTPQQMVEACWQAIVRGTLNNVEAFERERDASAARASVVPVIATLNGENV